MAEQLALQGWHVVAVARTTGALEELDDRIRAAGGASLRAGVRRVATTSLIIAAGA